MARSVSTVPSVLVAVLLDIANQLCEVLHAGQSRPDIIR